MNSKCSESAVIEHDDQSYSRVGRQSTACHHWQQCLFEKEHLERSRLGLFNGARCIVRKILYQKDAMPNDLPTKLPVCVFVEFSNFKGIGYKGTNLVPIVPAYYFFESNKENSKLSRKQIPLELADAMTIYRV